MKISLGLWISFVLLVTSCGGGSSSGGGGGGGDGDGDGSEDHVTLDSLPKADRDGFEQWKKQVIKDCAWEQAFPSLANEFPDATGAPYVARKRVDMHALLAMSGGVSLIAG